MFLIYVVSKSPHNVIEFLYNVEVLQKDQVIVMKHVSY